MRARSARRRSHIRRPCSARCRRRSAAGGTSPPASARILRIIHAQKDSPAEQDRRCRRWRAWFRRLCGQCRLRRLRGRRDEVARFLRAASAWPRRPACRSGSTTSAATRPARRDLTLRGHPEGRPWPARGRHGHFGGQAVSSRCRPVDWCWPPRCRGGARRRGDRALDEAKDLAASIRDRQLSWQAPAGEWFVVVMTDDLIYEGTHAAVSLAFKKPCIDLLTPEPTRGLGSDTSAVRGKLGPDLGGILSDVHRRALAPEPLVPSHALPRAALVADHRAGVQQTPRASCARPLLPGAGGRGRAGRLARYDFWNTVGELVPENYSARFRAGATNTTSSPAATC